MKRTIKFGIIALLAVFALSMTSCNLDEGNDDVPKFIEITGCTIVQGSVTVGVINIPTKGKEMTDKDLKAHASKDLSEATRNSFKIPLISDTTEKQYTGTGKWYIFLIFQNVSVKTVYAYTAGGNDPIEFDIQDETTKLAFSDFTNLSAQQ
jgi:hypothetical protein